MWVFTYLGRPLDKSDNYWPEVRCNIRNARQLLGRLRKLLRREGVESFMSDIFYNAVVHAVLLFRSKTWVLLAAMVKRLEVFHRGFLWQVTGKTERRQWDGTCKMEGEASVLR